MIDHWESAELAAAVLGVAAPEEDKDIEKIEDAFISKYGVDLDNFASIAEKLVPLCGWDVSPLTGNFRRGFIRDGSYIVKQIVPDEEVTPKNND